jgi:hypothetical protein
VQVTTPTLNKDINDLEHAETMKERFLLVKHHRILSAVGQLETLNVTK